MATALGGLVLSACGERAPLQPPGTSATASTYSTKRSSTTSIPTTTSTSSLSPNQSTTPPSGGDIGTREASTTIPTSNVSTAANAQTSQIEDVYGSFLRDIAELDDTLNASWIADLQKVATSRLVKAAEEQADTIEAAHEHTVGTLADAHETVVMTSGTAASLFDCLNEEDWYLVEDSTNQPDPEVTRGYFVGLADFVLQGGHWYVDVWQPAQGACHF